MQIGFSPEINCLVGNNGSGKTNLLDAVHYLCLTKSAFNAVDVQNIMHNQAFFSLQGDFDLVEKSLHIECLLEVGKKKQVILNGKPYEKMSEHIGLLPIVLIAPDDTLLIRGGSDERRRFFDGMLSQLDKNYLKNLIRYHSFLKQRNALLKQFSEHNRIDRMLLEPYDRELIALSIIIAQSRSDLIRSYSHRLLHHYSNISEKKEAVSIRYESDCLNQDFLPLFQSSLKKDLLLKRTNCGIHKDDYKFEIGGYPLKKFGSQGQQKTYLIALKLAQFHVLKEMKNTKPILLLDDIFDKLDDQRIKKLMDLVANHEFGQLFITDARPERSKRILQGISSHINFHEIQGGSVNEDLPHDY